MVFRRLGARRGLGVHWGTFQLTEERVDQPRVELAATLGAAQIMPGRFVTTDAGQGRMVP